MSPKRSLCSSKISCIRWVEAPLRYVDVGCILTTLFLSLLPVVELTIDNFETLVSNRAESEVWAVDFYAPWCGPCLQLAPQWRRLATTLKSLSNVRVGSVDCVAQQQLCAQQGIRSYPTLQLYSMERSSNIMSVHFKLESNFQTSQSCPFLISELTGVTKETRHRYATGSPIRCRRPSFRRAMTTFSTLCCRATCPGWSTSTLPGVDLVKLSPSSSKWPRKSWRGGSNSPQSTAIDFTNRVRRRPFTLIPAFAFMRVGLDCLGKLPQELPFRTAIARQTASWLGSSNK